VDRINGQLDLTDILFRLLDYMKYIAAAALVLAVLGAVMYKEPKLLQKYRAEISLYIVDTEKGELNYGDIQVASYLICDYMNAFENLSVRRAVIQALNLPYDEIKLSGMVDVRHPEDTHILEVSVYSADPDEAVKIAEAYAKAVSEFIAEKMSISRLPIWEEAHIAFDPVSMKADAPAGRIRSAVFCGIAGLFLSCASVICITLLDARVRAPKELETDVGIPVFGVLTQQKIKNADGAGLDYAGRELLNAMGEKLIVMKDDIRKIVLTSCGDGEGKSFAAICLTQTLAKLGYRAALVDGDFRTKHLFHPDMIPQKCIYSLVSLVSDPGLIDMLDKKPEDRENGLIILSGECNNPVALFNSPNFDLLISKLLEMNDFVFIDTASLAQVVDAAVIAKKCDAALLVVRHNKTRIADIHSVKKKIEETGCRLLGSIVNGVEFNNLSTRKNYRTIYKMCRKG